MLASDIARMINGRLIGDDVCCTRLAPLFQANLDDLTILAWPHDIRLAKKNTYAAIIMPMDWAADYLIDINKTVIVVDDLLRVFSALESYIRNTFKIPEKSIAPSVQIHPSASVGRAEISEHSLIHPQVRIEDGVRVGKGCRIEAGVVIHGTAQIGNNVVIGANSVIGSEAFVPFGVNAVLLPSLGSVTIEDNVHIGALCSIARGVIGQTWIKKNTLLDNMVHVGHDTVIGENVVIAAQTALAGFVEIGDQATLGGQVGVVPHTRVGRGARLSGKSLVRGVIGEHEIWSGNPSFPHKIYLKEYAKTLRKYRDSND